MSDDTDITRPPTELEVAQFVTAAAQVMSPAGMLLLRRILFQRDLLLLKEKEHAMSMSQLRG